MTGNVELLPDNYLARPVYRRRIGQWAILTIALSGLVCLFGYLQPKDVVRLEQEIVLLRQGVHELEAMGNRFALLTEELEYAAARQGVADFLQITPEWSDLLKDLSDATNGDLWLEEVTIRESEGETDDDRVPSSHIEIQGVAPSNVEIGEFMRRLSASKHFQELQLESSHEPQSPDGSVKVEFEISGIAL